MATFDTLTSASLLVYTMDLEGLELEMMALLPRVRSAEKLEEIAYVLDLIVADELRGNARGLNRLIMSYLTSREFDLLAHREDLLTRVVRMARQHLH